MTKKLDPIQPKKSAMDFKMKRAREQYREAEDAQSINADQALEVDRSGTVYKWAVYSKLLPHNNFGEVSAEDFNKLKKALETGDQDDFDAIPFASGCVRKLVNPQAPLSYVLAGQDNQSLTMPHSPSITSNETASEMMEVYEMAMHRDIPFATIEEGTDPATVRAIATLNAYGADFKGPKDGGAVTAKTLFRGIGTDETVGPYVSQLMYLPFDYGNIAITQMIREELDQTNSVNESGWLDIINGVQTGTPNYSGESYYAHTPRMLGSYVHNDKLFQAFTNASLILFQNNAPFDPAIPTLPKEEFFVGLGLPDLCAAVATVSKIALQTAWNQKWMINMRPRPETLAGRFHYQDTSAATYGLDSDDYGATTIAAMKTYNSLNFSEDTAFLPLIFPEGCPAHPEYPQGHATVAGACTTVLKAWFDTSQTWVGDLELNPQHSIDGETLVNYNGLDANQITVLGELNKLASNIANGRNIAGVHFRSAGDDGIALGEKVAIQFLKDLKETYNEEFTGWSLTKFDGTTITI